MWQYFKSNNGTISIVAEPACLLLDGYLMMVAGAGNVVSWYLQLCITNTDTTGISNDTNISIGTFLIQTTK